MTHKAIGYVRISRDEPRDGAPIAEKLADRAGQVRELAARHNLPLIDILQEAESGMTIADRPIFKRLLEMCRRRECTHIVTPEQARVLRGDKRDEAEIEDALADAGITLVSHEGTLEFGSEEFDPLPYEVRAMVARHEIRQYIKRRKRANAEKLRQNKRYGGPVPYGYTLDGEGGYLINPDTYPTVCRIFTEHIAGTSLNRLCIDLNAEGMPSPRGRLWSRTTLRGIILNPVYAGRHAQQHRVIRINQRRHLRPIPITDWCVSEIPGTWEHPISFDEWLLLRNRYSGTSRPYNPIALLSGLLRCQEGHPMVSSGERAYVCLASPSHVGQSIHKGRSEEFVFQAVRSLIGCLPVMELGETSPPIDREKLQKEYDKSLRLYRQAAEAYADLLDRALYYQQLFELDTVKFEQTVQKRLEAKRAAERALDAAQSRLTEPSMAEVQPVLCEVREVGFEAVWEQFQVAERRRLLGWLLEGVSVPEKTRRLEHTQRLELRWRAWVQPYVPMVVPEYRRRGNCGNGPWRK